MIFCPLIIDGSAQRDIRSHLDLFESFFERKFVAPGALEVLSRLSAGFVWKVDLCGFLVQRSCVERPTCHIHEQPWWLMGQCEEYISAGELGPDQRVQTLARIPSPATPSEDPLKDTSGLKLTAILCSFCVWT